MQHGEWYMKENLKTRLQRSRSQPAMVWSSEVVYTKCEVTCTMSLTGAMCEFSTTALRSSSEKRMSEYCEQLMSASVSAPVATTKSFWFEGPSAPRPG